MGAAACGPDGVEVASTRARQALEASDLLVELRDEAPSEGNHVKPRLRLTNNSSQPLSDFTVHYYFSPDPGRTVVLEDWWTPHSSVRVEALGPELQQLVYDFEGYTLLSGTTVPDAAGNVVGLHHADWSSWTRSDDWSYQGVGEQFSSTAFVVVRDAAGNVVHGLVPDEPGDGGAGPGDDPGEDDPPPGDPVFECRSLLSLTDVGQPLTAIWQGLETPESGKRSEPSFSLELGFSQPVSSSRVGDHVMFRGLVEASGGACLTPGVVPSEEDRVPVKVLSSRNAWNAGVLGGTPYPGSFNAVLLGDVSGLPSVSGPLLVRGDLRLSGFSVNHDSGVPTALVVGGELEVVNGSIEGDVYGRAGLSLPQNVGHSGNVHSLGAFDFEGLERALTMLADAAARVPATGSVNHPPGGTLTLSGSDPELNVFHLDSAQLGDTNHVRFSVPASSFALVVVEGNSLRFTNAGMDLGGVSPSQVLWVAPDADSVTLHSTAFQGSVVAPRAHVNLDNGELHGTLVAGELAGSGALRFFPLTLPEGLLGGRLIVEPKRGLRAGCRYALEIAAEPLTDDGACLDASVSIPFFVRSDDAGTVAGELDARYPSVGTTPVSFRTRDGISTPADEAMRRYPRAFGLNRAVDGFRRDRDPRPSGALPGQALSYYRQTYKGIGLRGYGYIVHEKEGVFRSAVGRSEPGLDLSTVAALSAGQAIEAAVASQGIAPRPWQNPTRFEAPGASLEIAWRRSGFRLIWRVDFERSGVPVRAVDIDATTGEALYAAPAAIAAPCTGFDPATATFDQDLDHSVDTHFNGTQPVRVGSWTAAGSSFVTLSSKTPLPINTTIPPRTAECNTSGTTNWNGSEDERYAAAAHSALQHAARTFQDERHPLEETLPAFSLPGGAPWAGIDGDLSRTLLIEILDPEVLLGAQWIFDANTIQTNRGSVEQSTMAHEFGHGALLHRRVTHSGLGFLDYFGVSGSVDEGFAELMAVFIKRRTFPGSPPELWACAGDLDCYAYVADPKLSGSLVPGVPTPDGADPQPNTFGGEFFSPEIEPCNEDNDYCGVHQNSTIPAHWAYLMAQGGAGINDLGCEYAVAPLHADLDRSLGMAMMIAFNAYAEALPESFGLDVLAASTELMADSLFGAGAAETANQAWTGVGAVEMATLVNQPLPKAGQDGVNPFSPGVQVVVGEPGPWQVIYAPSPNFDGTFGPNVVVETEVNDLGDGQYQVTALDPPLDQNSPLAIPLRPGRTHYWTLVRPNGDPTACPAVRSTFKTHSLKPNLSSPAFGTHEGTLIFSDPPILGWFLPPEVRDRTVVDIRIEQIPHSTCEVEWEPTGTYPGGQGTDLLPGGEYRGINLNDANVLLKDGRIGRLGDQNFAGQAFRILATAGGECQSFDARIVEMDPVELISPAEQISDPVSGQPGSRPAQFATPHLVFRWRAVDNAEKYEIHVRERSTGEEILRKKFDDVNFHPGGLDLPDEARLSSSTVNGVTTLSYDVGLNEEVTRISDRDPARVPEWAVRAISPEGVAGAFEYRRYWLDGGHTKVHSSQQGKRVEAGDSILLESEDLNAELLSFYFLVGPPGVEPGTDIGGDFPWRVITGRSGASIPTDGSLMEQSLPASIPNRTKVVVEYLSESSQGMRRPRTRGGHFYVGIDPEEWESTAPCGDLNQACCEVGECYVDAENVCNDGICEPCGREGGGCCEFDECNSSENLCVDDQCVPCGSSGTPCCDSGSPCQNGANCESEMCVACGGVGQACCDQGTACASSSSICTAGTCAPCGGTGQACCTGSTCGANNLCSAGQCVCGGLGEPCCEPGSTCAGSNVCQGGTCQVPCGGAGEQCCGGTTCHLSGYTCSSNVCVTCGGLGDLCCGTGPQCAGGLECNGSICDDPEPSCPDLGAVVLTGPAYTIGNVTDILHPWEYNPLFSCFAPASQTITWNPVSGAHDYVIGVLNYDLTLTTYTTTETFITVSQPLADYCGNNLVRVLARNACGESGAVDEDTSELVFKWQ
jgi:choice-of-anchor A domain-containing protein